MSPASNRSQEATVQDSDNEEQSTNYTTPLLKASDSQSSSILQSVGKLLQDWWLWEVIASLTSLLSITAITVILIIYNSSSLPDWPSFLTINSVISVFATIAKLSLGSVVAAGISQSKWLWYRQEHPRRLQDLQLFDDASRGPWGAAHLLISLRARHLAFIGATITVLTLLFDPFIQQVVVYPNRLVPAKINATIVRAQHYEARNEGLHLPSVVDLSMKAAVYNGIFDTQEKANLGITYTCSSGNCTWTRFSSLAICTRCVNITSYVKKLCHQTRCHEFSLPGGPTISGQVGQINSSGTSIAPSLKGIQASVVQFSSLTSKSRNNSIKVLAVECAMWYCVQSYTASVDDGEPSQTVISSWRNDSAGLLESSDLYYNPPPSITETPQNASTFKVALSTATALNKFMSESFTGSGGMNRSGSAFSSDIMQALYKTENLTSRMQNLAISMTNNIREHNSTSSNLALGTTWKTETYVHVRWGWFAFPTGLLLCTLLFLIGAIFETSRRKILVWKANDLAMLFHGRGLKLTHDESKTAVNRPSNLSQQAKDMMIELVEIHNNDWRLIQR